MILVQFYFAHEMAREVTYLLGNRGLVHLIDLNKNVNSFQRVFVSEVKRVNAIHQQLAFLLKQTKIYHDIRPSNLLTSTQQLSHTEIETLAQEIAVCKSRVETLARSITEFKGQRSKFIEKREILRNAQKFFNKPEIQQQANRISLDAAVNAPLLLEEELLEAGMNAYDGPTIPLTNLNDLALNYIVGSISTSNADTLHKILIRHSRNNIFFADEPLEEPLFEVLQTGDEKEVMKSVFVLYTHGTTLLSRARKIIDSMGGVIVDIAADPEVYDGELNLVNTQIDDLSQIIKNMSETLGTELSAIAEKIDDWRIIFKREYQLYQTLNMFGKSEHMNQLIAEGWVPASSLLTIKEDLKTHEATSAVVVQEIITNKVPPTYHRTNKFTQAFQSIVDAYGISSYQEVNPGLATIVTFPFMFSIMFGDLGHGFILFLVALYLVGNEKKLARVKKDEISAMAYDGRYILLLMGIFSMYTGFLYNDIFSKSMTIFKSGWKWPEDFEAGQTIEATKVGTYLFGLDFAWHGTENNLIFTNSYKMKLSILMGYVHMSYSFMLSLVNYRFRNSEIDIWGNFIPGFIFMQSIFGYLSFTIIYKWACAWSDSPAPGLLNMLINMFLSPGKIDVPLYKGQSFVQIILLLAAVACVPILLGYKPWKLKKLNDEGAGINGRSFKQREYDSLLADFEEEQERYPHQIGRFEEPGLFEFGDVMIHQVIHTIEFCLNCVSHTASYLRLWALSLAHAQLSTVLWSMTIANAFSSENSGSAAQVAKVIVLFSLWFVLTVCILVLMEGTSAMLHSLRLHWVEAMSKFFEGEGYSYAPFKLIHLEDDLDDEEN